MEGGAFFGMQLEAFSVRGRGKVKRRGPAGGRSSLHTRDGGGGAVPVAENREIRQGKRYAFQREPSYGYSHLLL